MEMKKYLDYRNVSNKLPETYLAWPLYGTGIETMGVNGKPVERKFPDHSPDELIMRIDAVSLCFSDIKEIELGQNHPRFTGRDLATDPIVVGHEVSFTVVSVGKNLENQYKAGDRFTLEPDVWFEGKSIPFCFVLDAGFQQYVKIDHRILKGDAGNYLIPIPDDMSYAASSLTEPWGCVEASYRAKYRSRVEPEGITLIMGGEASRKGYLIENLLTQDHKPSKIYVCRVPDDLLKKIENICKVLGIQLIPEDKTVIMSGEIKFDDIILLDLPINDANQLSKLMKKKAVMAILKEYQPGELVEIDLGQLHYDYVYYVGSTGLDIAQAYQATPPRSNLKPNGTAWIVGAGGPMGRMHLQRAIEDPAGPSTIVASEVTKARFEALNDFINMADKQKKELILVNPEADPEKSDNIMQRIMKAGGFDDIVLMVAIPSVVEEVSRYFAKNGVMNIFAGVGRGTLAKVDPGLIYGQMQTRWISHSGSDLDDQKEVVRKVIEKKLKPEFSMAAVGGFLQIPDGLRAMKNFTFPGKITIFPHVLDFPITALKDLKENAPLVYAALEDGHTWTLEAEKIFINEGLK